MAIVLATDVETNDGPDGGVRIVAERGDPLPASLKDKRDEFLMEGILVDERQLPENKELMVTTLSQLQALAARGELTDEDFEKLGEQDEIGTPPPGDAHIQSYADRREIVKQVSGAHQQVARDRGAGRRAAEEPEHEAKAPAHKPAAHTATDKK